MTSVPPALRISRNRTFAAGMSRHRNTQVPFTPPCRVAGAGAAPAFDGWGGSRRVTSLGSRLFQLEDLEVFREGVAVKSHPGQNQGNINARMQCPPPAATTWRRPHKLISDPDPT